MNALFGLSEGNRLVGIISHVSELKERIDRQVVVTKEKPAVAGWRLFVRAVMFMRAERQDAWNNLKNRQCGYYLPLIVCAYGE